MKVRAVIELAGRWDEARVEAVASALSAKGELLWLDGAWRDGLGGELPTDLKEGSILAAGAEGRVRVLAGESVVDALREVDDDGLWAGYLGYDAHWSWQGGPPAPIAAAKRLEVRTAVDPNTPVALLHRYGACVYVERRGRAYVFAESRSKAEALASSILGRTTSGEAASDAPTPNASTRAHGFRASSLSAHAARIAAALDAIGEGEIYQINLARRFSARFDGEPLDLWRALRKASPVPLGFYLDGGDHQVLGRSMETFLRWRGGRLETSPIKGTLARRGDDQAEAKALVADPKEHAEHAMIVDLMRNDLGRLALTGSVRVERAMRVEPYRKLNHLVSTVSCEPRPEVDLEHVLTATFPPGSISGTPKVRAVELIDRLEGARGVYCGALGVFSKPLCLAVAIRTAVLRHGHVDYRAGGGIVASSQIDRELAETDLKAAAFIDALALLADDSEHDGTPAQRSRRSDLR
ncbi:MAG: anthranilate synthase component I family protein [Myxococcota bacterium]